MEDGGDAEGVVTLLVRRCLDAGEDGFVSQAVGLPVSRCRPDDAGSVEDMDLGKDRKGQKFSRVHLFVARPPSPRSRSPAVSSTVLPPVRVSGSPVRWRRIEEQVNLTTAELARPVVHRAWMRPPPGESILRRDNVHRFAPQPLPQRSSLDMYAKPVELTTYNPGHSQSWSRRGGSPRSLATTSLRPPQATPQQEALPGLPRLASDEHLEPLRQKIANSALRFARTSDVPHSLLPRCGAFTLR